MLRIITILAFNLETFNLEPPEVGKAPTSKLKFVGRQGPNQQAKIQREEKNFKLVMANCFRGKAFGHWPHSRGLLPGFPGRNCLVWLGPPPQTT